MMMRRYLLHFLLLSYLTSCVQQKHFYEVVTQTDLQRRPSDDAETLSTIQPDDTISVPRKIKPNGQYELVSYKGYGGYVRSTGFIYLYSARSKPLKEREDFGTAFGVDLGYASNNAFRVGLIGRFGPNFFRAGYSGQDAGQQGKRVSSQLANYGRTITGSGNFLSSVDIGYGREVIRNLFVEAEVTFGWHSYYTNYADKRFTGGGYYLIHQTEFAPGFGLGGRYFATKNVNVFGGYNTLLGAHGGIGFTIGEQ